MIGQNWGIAIPAFLTFTLMPFTYSIANGLGAGFIAYVVIRTVQGKAKEIHPLLWVVAAALLGVLWHWTYPTGSWPELAEANSY